LKEEVTKTVVPADYENPEAESIALIGRTPLKLNSQNLFRATQMQKFSLMTELIM